MSKNSSAFCASAPQNCANSSSTRERRSAFDSPSYTRALSPPTKPKMMPGLPSSGESSNVAVTRPLSDRPVPLKPCSRQNGFSYRAATFVSVPWPIRCVSWSRSNGSAGE